MGMPKDTAEKLGITQGPEEDAPVVRKELTKEELMKAVPPFVAFLMQIQEGQLLRDANVEMRQLMERIRDTGKKGQLTIKIGIKPKSVGRVPVMTIAAAVDTKEPELPVIENDFFLTPDNQPTRQHPAQLGFKGEGFAE